MQQVIQAQPKLGSYRTLFLGMISGIVGLVPR
jgi:hypothetical protein